MFLHHVPVSLVITSVSKCQQSNIFSTPFIVQYKSQVNRFYIQLSCKFSFLCLSDTFTANHKTDKSYLYIYLGVCEGQPECHIFTYFFFYKTNTSSSISKGGQHLNNNDFVRHTPEEIQKQSEQQSSRYMKKTHLIRSLKTHILET